MEIISCLGWLILIGICVAFLCNIMPWWLVVLLTFGGMFIYYFFLHSDYYEAPKPIKNQEKVKKDIEESEKGKGEKNTATSNTDNGGNRINVNIGTETYYQKNDDFDYDRYIAAKREEQAAYDDFIASSDMDD
ncbi:MAG: hypothetical protein J5805_04305 [Bacteroidaceae bacterium]|nr:hypothetical protein [Bacteroidaceae bacterium]